jgi:exodeoxyribonuclease VII small subunit
LASGRHSALDAEANLSYSPTVASAPKNAGQTTSTKAGSLPFEEALKKLEAIVTTMESDDLPLENLLAKYEEGTRLARTCQEKLAEAELKIQQLEKTSAGDFKLKSFAAPEAPGE